MGVAESFAFDALPEARVNSAVRQPMATSKERRGVIPGTATGDRDRSLHEENLQSPLCSPYNASQTHHF
jgi:hypothetical protein